MNKTNQAIDWIGRINLQLDQDLSNRKWPCTQLSKAMHYAVCNGGKRTRATLSYIIGTGLDLTPEEIDPMAMAIECLHAYTLIHDDLPAMDDDDWRRHQPSCHKAFDEATAILAGDALQTHAFTLLAESNLSSDCKIDQIKYFSQAVGAKGLCSGQSMDMKQEASNCNLKTIQQIHHLKTGVLLGASCRLPGIAANRSKAELDQLQQLGEKLGQLLQINDDLIDSNKNTGKTAGKDIEQNKACLSTHLSKQDSLAVLNSAVKDCETHIAQLNFLPATSKYQLWRNLLSPSSALLSSITCHED